MPLRKHQKELKAVVDGIIAGSEIRKIIVSACPGAGKSLLPQIAGNLISAGIADALCWVVPRLTLQSQGESDFQDPVFRKMINHKLNIRSSTNDRDPCRGLDGFVTTFQALAVDSEKTVLSDFEAKRYILILDENHHIPENNEASWHDATEPLVKAAAYLILMTGTMLRGDNGPIAFIPYKDEPGGALVPDMKPDKNTAIIVYTRRDALAEKAILPLSFHLSGGKATWINKKGTVKKADLSTTDTAIANQALFTALSTEFADTLLENGISHWQRLKRRNRTSKLLIVTANIDEAKRVSDKLRMETKWIRHGIATSHESKKALQEIKRFKEGRIDVLVAINMVYEGLDVKSATHIICLTNIRSTPWIEQMVARVVRIDPQAGAYDDQIGYVFAPDDINFRDIVEKIKQEQQPFAKKKDPEQQDLFGNAESQSFSNGSKIKPLSSAMTGHREVFIGARAAMETLPPTPSEVEDSLRNDIESHVRLYSFNNRYQAGELNSEIKIHFGKARAEMTQDDLCKTYEWVKLQYPVDRIGRGSGIQRVPIKARIWEN